MKKKANLPTNSHQLKILKTICSWPPILYVHIHYFLQSKQDFHHTQVAVSFTLLDPKKKKETIIQDGVLVVALVLAAFLAAISSRSFHVASRFFFISSSRFSSSWNWSKHSSKSSGSESEKILRTFRVKLCTAWFQWLLEFFSNAGMTIGRITLRFCLIRFSMWSLFHKNRALSATCTYKNRK